MLCWLPVALKDWTVLRAVTCQASTSEAQRLLFWAGRKAAFPAVGRISPDYYCMDGTIPRARLPFVLRRMREMSEIHRLAIANVFHAGDGNLHPLILYDSNQPGELERAEAFGADILRLCVEVGGVLTGEHGVGVEKRDLMEPTVRRRASSPNDTGTSSRGKRRLKPCRRTIHAIAASHGAQQIKIIGTSIARC